VVPVFFIHLSLSFSLGLSFSFLSSFTALLIKDRTSTPTLYPCLLSGGKTSKAFWMPLITTGCLKTPHGNMWEARMLKDQVALLALE